MSPVLPSGAREASRRAGQEELDVYAQLPEHRVDDSGVLYRPDASVEDEAAAFEGVDQPADLFFLFAEQHPGAGSREVGCGGKPRHAATDDNYIVLHI